MSQKDNKSIPNLPLHCLSYFDLWLVITPQDLQTFLIIDTTSWVNAKNVSQCPMSTIWVRVVVFNATFNNISVILWRSVLLVEKTRVPGENHRPAASHGQTLSHQVVSGFELTMYTIWVFITITIMGDIFDTNQSHYINVS